MLKNKDKGLYFVSVLIIILSIVVAACGLFDAYQGRSFEILNQFGDIVKLYGKGLYEHDSWFMAPIFRGTDLVILALVIPTLIVAMILDSRKKTLKTRLFLISMMAVVAYYATSIAFGVYYNYLHLVYIALFSLSLFGLIIGIRSIKEHISPQVDHLPYKGLYVFLILSGVALIMAWVPDILVSLQQARGLAKIEIYTTSITNVIDMGIIGPSCLISLFLLRKRENMGFIMLTMLLVLCVVVGIMVPVQTLFQMNDGIFIPMGELITKVVIFMVLAMFALYFCIAFYRGFKKVKE